MISAETLLDIPLLSVIPAQERARIAERAAEIQLQAGAWLLLEGESPSFFALLSGRIEVTKRVGDSDRTIAAYLPGECFGEVPLLLNSPAVAGLRAAEPSRALRLDALDFRNLIENCAQLREQIVRMMITRVGRLQQFTVETPVPTVTIIGSRFDLQCHNVRDFLARNHFAVRWLEPDDPTVATRFPEGLGDGPYPIVVLPDGSNLSAPSNREIASRLGLQIAPIADQVYDVVIIGAGPAGLAASVYSASEGLRTLLIERSAPGGQAGSSSRIENYLGFPAGVSGDDLSKRAWSQAKRFGAEMLSARDVLGILPAGDGDPHSVVLDGGERVAGRALILATGVSWRKLEAEGIADFTGRGVYYGAARTEALATRGKDVFLVGGGNSAGQAAMFFADYASRVTLLVRGNALKKSMSQYLIDELQTKANVHVEVEREIVAASGTDHLEMIVVKHLPTNEHLTYQTEGLFVLIGADAETRSLPDEIIRDADGYICTGRDMLDFSSQVRRTWPLERDPYLLETSVPGIFAAGDVRHGSIKRVASSVGEGSMCIAFIHQYLATADAAIIASRRSSRAGESSSRRPESLGIRV
ncbi:MAG TPA: FAD-dependent oxidoreductase [Candidatus Baltobacteraceae bacterium]|jgi:thioredoxin reductase (NADPH)|nr:FAD-dependent oxidoreductase [Candidatus Baltobacteraceae bacterium]